MARRVPDPDQTPPETGVAQGDPGGVPQPEQGTAYFDQALFDLHYHLLAVRIAGLPPVPNPEDYGITVDRDGNVTRTDMPPAA